MEKRMTTATDLIRPDHKHNGDGVEYEVRSVAAQHDLQRAECGLHSYMSEEERLKSLHHKVMYAPVTRIDY